MTDQNVEAKPDLKIVPDPLPDAPAPEQDPLKIEADALAVAFGIRVLDVTVRGVKIRIREFTPDDLHPLYAWLAGMRKTWTDLGTADNAVAQEMIRDAVMSGIDNILHVVTDGVIPKGAKLPMSVIGKFVDGIIQVNEDFFEVLPSLFRLLGGFPALLGQGRERKAETEAEGSDTESGKTSAAAPARQPREFPEPARARLDDGRSSSADSSAEATP